MNAKFKLLALILAFFGPLFLAMLMYFNPRWFMLPGGGHHGELIDPARPLAAFAATSREGRALPSDLLHGRWTLLYWGAAGCDLACEADLFKMRQVRLSLGRDRTRVQTVYLSGEPDGLPERLLNRYTQLTVARLESGGAFAEQLAAYPKNSVYVVDPLGNLMMRYPGDAFSRDMLKDLKKLLKLSNIG